MTLQELINLEEKLLQYECDNKFNMNFDDYIKLNNVLKEVGNITTQYFMLIEQYDKELLKNGLTKETYKKQLTDYNQNMLNQNVELKNELLTFLYEFNK